MVARGRELHAVAAALEQLGAQVFLQQAQLARNGELHGFEQPPGAVTFPRSDLTVTKARAVVFRSRMLPCQNDVLIRDSIFS